MHFVKHIHAAFLALVLLASCGPLIGAFNEQAYRNATDLKARSVALIAKSDEPYRQYRTAAEDLLLDIDKAYEYSAGLPRNTTSAKQWDLLRDPDNNFIAGAIRAWRRQGQMSEVFAAEFARATARHFDYIICLEVEKRAQSCEQ